MKDKYLPEYQFTPNAGGNHTFKVTPDSENRFESILPGGYVAFRIRGTAGFRAACLIKDLEIYSEK